MICTFCGAENPTVNRFCGMCGVRVERRNAERRVDKREDIVCHSCGHVNEPRFKFCGICGAGIERRAQERRGNGERSRAVAYANAQLPTPDPRRTFAQRSIQTPSRSATATVVAEEEAHTSTLGGPSFLGLSDPQGDSEYLLEEERSSGRGIRSFLLLVILAAIVGLIYVQYRSSLKGGSKSPELPKPDPATVPQRGSQNQSPGLQKAIAAVTGAQTLQAATLALSKTTIPESKDTGGGDPIEKKLRKVTVAEMRDDDAREKVPDAPAPTKNKPSPALVRAQQYLQGRGVRQNCEQGLIYLKAATQDNDPSAAVQMGALYASGFCVQQSRVKAYQWFSTAREQQPENRWIAKNLSQLWAQMTPQERRQIR
ncbi:MAG TPA: zinc ribbon domain-containing protein [Candidatus Angelobacter sp.]|nr:zinc ribbon domain-containing protein [Candidatus Angelobacter sp.]